MTTTLMRTYDTANYSVNRKPENRRIYAEQQVAWFYVDLLKAQRRLHVARKDWWVACEHYWHRVRKAERDLAEAHASLDALTTRE